MYAPWKRFFAAPRYTPDIDGLIEFLRRLDPDEAYDFWDSNCCALAEFSKAVARTPEYRRTLGDQAFPLDVIAVMRPWTFGALLMRARMLKLLATQYSMDAIVTALLLEMRKKHA